MIQTTSPEIGQAIHKFLNRRGVIVPHFRHYEGTIISEFEFNQIYADDLSLKWSDLDAAYTLSELIDILPKTLGGMSSLQITYVSSKSSYMAYEDSGFTSLFLSDEQDIFLCIADALLFCDENNHPLNLEKK